MGFSRQEYWSGLSFPSPGDLPDLGIESRSLALQADSLPVEIPGKPKNTGVGCHFLLHGIFPNPRVRTRVSCISGTDRQILYHSCHLKVMGVFALCKSVERYINDMYTSLYLNTKFT